MITYLSLGLGFISLIAFMAKCYKQRSVAGVFIKNLTSIFFLFTGASAMFYNEGFWKYGALILLGGVFGMLGDIYLDQKWVYPEHKDQYLTTGFTVFGIGHFFFIAAICMDAGFGIKDMIVPVLVGAVVCIFTIATEKLFKNDFGKFRLIVAIYCLVIGTMAGTALWAAIQTGGAVEYIVFTVGGVLFLLSDIVLSDMYFGKDKNTSTRFIINHGTYYAAQFLIAFTVFLIK